MTEEQIETEELPMPSMGPVTLQVCSPASAGKTVKSRFGEVAFDKDGLAEITVPTVADIELLDQLQWLMPDDRRKFLGIKAKLKETSVVEELSEKANAKIANLIAENTKLANANAQGSEHMDILLKDKEALEAQIETLEKQAKGLAEENEKLKTSLAAKSKEDKKAAKAAKEDKKAAKEDNK